MPVISVTGASGKADRGVVRDLPEHDYEVHAVDLVAPAANIGAPVLRADLTDYRQAADALAGVAAVIHHLANIPAPGLLPSAVTFDQNTAMDYAVFAAADTVTDWPSTELMAQVYPCVPTRRELAGFETILSIDRARAVLGYKPAHSWRDYLTEGD